MSSALALIQGILKDYETHSALISDKIKHNRLNVGRIALELVGALINCSLLQSGGGGA